MILLSNTQFSSSGLKEKILNLKDFTEAKNKVLKLLIFIKAATIKVPLLRLFNQLKATLLEDLQLFLGHLLKVVNINKTERHSYFH